MRLTVGEFRAFVNDTGYRTEAEEKGGMHHWNGEEWEQKVDVYWDNTGFLQTERQPVVGVSWNDAQEYVKWLKKNPESVIGFPLRQSGSMRQGAGVRSINTVGVMECLQVV